jgi:alkylated DNA repair dioxygenase AlkB
MKHVFRQVTLFGTCDPSADLTFGAVERLVLDAASWVEHAPNWLDGSDVLFDELLERLDFRQRTGVPMYDSVVDEPRLSSWWHERGGSPEPLSLLADIRRALSGRYHRPFDSIGFNLYRDRHDSVAWHGDRHRHHVTDPVVAIVSLGTPRPLKLRPRGGGTSRSWDLGTGDLFVMGGACQHDWQHCVPKRGRAVGPRMSVTFRHETR